MAAKDDALGEAPEPNPVPKAAENAAHRRAMEANPVPRAPASDDDGETEAIRRTAKAQTANRVRWAEANDGAGQAEETAVRMAPAAAGNGAPGEIGAIRQTANRERLRALGKPVRVEAGLLGVAPALAQRAVAASGAIRQAEALSQAPMERAIATRHPPRRFKNASSGCSTPTRSRNGAKSRSALPTARPRK